MVKVEIYAYTFCPYCRAAKKLLKEKGVKYTCHRVNIVFKALPTSRYEEMVQRSGNTTVPQIFIDDKCIGGYSDMKALDDKGKLNKLLEL